MALYYKLLHGVGLALVGRNGAVPLDEFLHHTTSHLDTSPSSLKRCRSIAYSHDAKICKQVAQGQRRHIQEKHIFNFFRSCQPLPVTLDSAEISRVAIMKKLVQKLESKMLPVPETIAA